MAISIPERRSPVPAIAVLLILHAGITVVGVALMLQAFGDELDDRLDRRVTQVERDLDRDFDRIERTVQQRLREELDRRLPAGATTPAP